MKPNLARVHSLLLALFLQFSPGLKILQTSSAVLNSPFAIVLKWVSGAAILLGGYHAVSAASSAVLITSPTTSSGTNGVAFRYTITTNDPKTDTGHSFSASPLPSNFRLTVVEGTFPAIATITGTPTNFGTWLVHLTACYEVTTCAVPTNLLLTIYGKPIITNQPASVGATPGGNASFAVVAGGLPPPTYLWRLNAGPLPGETNAILNLSNLQANQAGNYTVIVSNFLGSVTSTVATLTLNSGSGPSIVTHPHDATVLLGGTTNFTVTASGSPPLTYLWRRAGTPLPGSDNPTYNLPAVTAAAAGLYSVIVSNSINSITSSAANLYVVQQPRIVSPRNAGGLAFDFVKEAGAGYDVLFSPVVPSDSWSLLTNFPAGPSGGNISVVAPATNNAGFYKLRLIIP